MSRTFTAFPALVLTVAVCAAAPACASGGYYPTERYPSQHDSREVERLAYDNGYRQGFPHGERDARDHRGYRIDRDRDYRNADSGYRGYGDRNAYRRFYGDGYEAGYSEGYNRVARSVRNDRGQISPPVTAPNGFPRGRNVYASPAVQTGYRDGFEAGRDDARDRQGNDPRRSKRYREGDNDYDSRYGSRDQYKQEYRAAFQQGYEQGYREIRR